MCVTCCFWDSCIYVIYVNLYCMTFIWIIILWRYEVQLNNMQIATNNKKQNRSLNPRNLILRLHTHTTSLTKSSWRAVDGGVVTFSIDPCSPEINICRMLPNFNTGFTLRFNKQWAYSDCWFKFSFLRQFNTW